jgi:hypothetical protein
MAASQPGPTAAFCCSMPPCRSNRESPAATQDQRRARRVTAAAPRVSSA